MAKLVHIGVACSSDVKPRPEALSKAVVFARKLAEFKDEVALLTGGGGGLMTVISKEFSEMGGAVVGVLPLEAEDVPPQHPRWNPYNTIALKTGMTYQARSIPLVRSSDSFVVLGGGIGTMIEALLAYAAAKPLVVLTGTGYPSDNLKNIAENGYFDHKKIVKVFFTEDPIEAAEKAYLLAKEYRRSKQKLWSMR